MDLGFERVDRDIRDLRTDVKEQIAGVRGDIDSLRGDVDGLRMLLVRLTGGMVVGLGGVIATIAVSGVGG